MSNARRGDLSLLVFLLAGSFERTRLGVIAVINDCHTSVVPTLYAAPPISSESVRSVRKSSRRQRAR